MRRPLISLLLIPILLAAQSVICCAHTYGCVDPSADGPPAPLHVHIGGHVHGHGDHPCHHHKPTESEPDCDLSAPVDHDDDAIYIAEQSAVANSKPLSSKVESAFVAVVSLIPRRPVLERSEMTHGSFCFQSNRAIYLQTSALLI